MAMTAAGLAAAITIAQGPSQDTSIQDAANLKIATGIINYLKSNAVVLPTALVAPPAGGPVTGTGTLS